MTTATFGTLAVVLIVSTLPADDADRQSPRDRRAQGNQRQRGPRDISAMFKRFDADNNGSLEGREIPPQMRRRIQQLDLNKDGKLTLDEVKKARAGAGGGSGQPTGEVITGAAKGERFAESLKVGDMAPDFTLPDPAGKNQITLSSFQGKKPVVLVFGSYT